MKTRSTNARDQEITPDSVCTSLQTSHESNPIDWAIVSRIPAMVYFVVLLLAPLAVQGQFLYTTNNGELTITGYTGSNEVVVIPEMVDGLPVTQIGDMAFFQLSRLTSVTIPNSVINLGGYSFYDCANLANVTVGANVVSIGEWAFSWCISLSDITLGNSVVDIESSAFSSCKSLTDITIPASVTGLGEQAFASCANLTSISLPNSITNIGNGAFYRCANLTNVLIGTGVTSIGEGAFYRCDNLRAITVDTPNTSFCSVDGVLFSESTNLLIQFPGGKSGSYLTPETVTSIADGAFQYCVGLAGVALGDSVTNIGSWVFSSCTNLVSVSLGNGLNSIGDGAFSACASLNSVSIPNSVTEIGFEAFGFCSSLASLTMPNSITNIRDYAFYSCNGLTQVYFQGDAPSLGEDVFTGSENATIYYSPGTTGWEPIFGGRPTVLWHPVIQTEDENFGVRSNRFGFNITGPSNLILVVEACTNLVNPAWSVIATNTLAGGSSYFGDSEWTNYSARFYRLRSP